MEPYGEVGDISSMGEYRWAAAEGSEGECKLEDRPPDMCVWCAWWCGRNGYLVPPL